MLLNGRVFFFFFLLLILLLVCFCLTHSLNLKKTKEALLTRLTRLTGLSLSVHGRDKICGNMAWRFVIIGVNINHSFSHSLPILQSSGEKDEGPLDILDLLELGDRVKYMDIVSACLGNFLLFKSFKEGDRGVTKHLLRQVFYFA